MIQQPPRETVGDGGQVVPLKEKYRNGSEGAQGDSGFRFFSPGKWRQPRGSSGSSAYPPDKPVGMDTESQPLPAGSPNAKTQTPQANEVPQPAPRRKVLPPLPAGSATIPVSLTPMTVGEVENVLLVLGCELKEPFPDSRIFYYGETKIVLPIPSAGNYKHQQLSSQQVGDVLAQFQLTTEEFGIARRGSTPRRFQ